MSKLFFDHLFELDEIKIRIDQTLSERSEKEEIWELIDEFVNNRIIASILEELDESCHEEFIVRFIDKPFDIEIVDYLNSRLPLAFEELVNARRQQILDELKEILLLEETGLKKSKKKKRKK